MQSSKQFLIDRILEQAKLEGVSLTDIEIRMLKFSEASSSKDLEAAELFERDYNDEEYEARIAGLIRNAYERAGQNGDQEAWDSALVRVAGRDLYLNVMIRSSGIEKNTFPGEWKYGLYAMFPWALTLAGVVLFGFSPLGARLIHNDTLRLAITICIVVIPCWVLGRPKRRNKNVRRTRTGVS